MESTLTQHPNVDDKHDMDEHKLLTDHNIDSFVEENSQAVDDIDRSEGVVPQAVVDNDYNDNDVSFNEVNSAGTIGFIYNFTVDSDSSGQTPEEIVMAPVVMMSAIGFSFLAAFSPPCPTCVCLFADVVCVDMCHPATLGPV